MRALAEFSNRQRQFFSVRLLKDFFSEPIFQYKLETQKLKGKQMSLFYTRILTSSFLGSRFQTYIHLLKFFISLLCCSRKLDTIHYNSGLYIYMYIILWLCGYTAWLAHLIGGYVFSLLLYNKTFKDIWLEVNPSRKLQFSLIGPHHHWMTCIETYLWGQILSEMRAQLPQPQYYCLFNPTAFVRYSCWVAGGLRGCPHIDTHNGLIMFAHWFSAELERFRSGMLERAEIKTWRDI